MAKIAKDARQRRSHEAVNAEKDVIQAQRELEAKLQTVRRVYYGNGRWTWRNAEAIRVAVDKGILKVIHTKSNSSYPEGHFMHDAYPWEDKDSHCTYDGCHDFELRWNGDDEYGQPIPGASLRYTIWDGENLRGDRTQVRVRYILVGDWTKLKDVREAVENRFHNLCEEMYDEEQERKRQTGAKFIGQAILKAIANRDDVEVERWEPIPEEQDKETPED